MTDKEKIKKIIMEEARCFCDLLDTTIDPPCLDYSIDRDGLRIKISTELATNNNRG